MHIVEIRYTECFFYQGIKGSDEIGNLLWAKTEILWDVKHICCCTRLRAARLCVLAPQLAAYIRIK